MAEKKKRQPHFTECELLGSIIYVAGNKEGITYYLLNMTIK